MFVSSTVAQALAFASKIATAMVIPQLAHFLSIYSPRKAIQLTYFSSISNCIGTLLEARSWQHTRNIPKFSTRVSLKSWLMIFMSLLLWLVILVSDLLVFQLARRHYSWIEYPNADIANNFNVASSPLTPTFNVSAPLALVDTEESLRAFKNNTYIPTEYYEYVNFKPLRVVSFYETTYEMLYDVPNATVKGKTPEQGEFNCLCGQQVDTVQVRSGLPYTLLLCMNSDYSPPPYNPSIGFNKATNVLAYQGDDGAHFSLLTSKVRDNQRINETDNYPTTTKKLLDETVSNHTLISMQLNGTSYELDLDYAFEYLAQWRYASDNLKVILAYYRIDKDYAYGRIPRYTYNYLIFEIIGLVKELYPGDTFSAPGIINYNYMSYSSQNIFVPGKQIDSKYLGIDPDNKYGPRSTSILTNESPEHIVISMLSKPQRPIMVKSIEMIDALPALLLIISAGGLSLFLFIYRLLHQFGLGSRIPFDPYLELFHCAVNNQSTSTANSLLIKMQETDLIMVNGYSPDFDGNKLGLVSRRVNILPFANEKVFK